MKAFLKRMIASIFCPRGRKCEAAHYLKEIFGPALYRAARAFGRSERSLGDKVRAFDLVCAGYFALAGPIEPEDLKALRLEIQEKAEDKLAVGIVVTRTSDPKCGRRVTFSGVVIRLAADDLHPEVAR